MDELEENEALYKMLKKHYKRSGIRRLYSYDTELKESRLLLEFVIRGHVLFKLRLWKRKGLWY